MAEQFGACVVLIPEYTGLPDEVEGGHHITLAYFGDNNLDDAQEVELLRISASLMGDVANGPMISLATDGYEALGENGDATVLMMDPHPESAAVVLRTRLLEEMSSELRAIFNRSETYPEYRPHMTLGYKSEGFELAPHTIPPERVAIRGIGVWNGGARTFLQYEHDATMAHYGIIRKSGRYPWGSGDNPYQRSQAFYKAYNQLKAEGLSEPEIARMFGESASPSNSDFNTSALRQTRSQAKDAVRAGDRAMILRLRDKGMSNQAIANRMGKPESTVRSLMKDAVADRVNLTQATADQLKERIDSGVYLDIGKGTENLMGVSPDRLKTAVAMLKDEGYVYHKIKVLQLGTGHETTVKILTPPGTNYAEVHANKDLIKTIDVHSDDKGRSFTKPGPPKSVSSKRLAVVYAEDGGTDRDGLIEIRPGAKDLDIGQNRYAQVRIAVDDTHYLKGMAVYSDNLPDGVDIRFNTNKSRDSNPNKVDVLKDLKRDKKTGELDLDAPFGSMIKPGGQRGAVNIVNEEGDWAAWSKTLSSQMMSKQSEGLAKQQLRLTQEAKQAELDEIKSLTNATVKKRLLEAYADGADSSAVTLKAMGLPRTATKVILPYPGMKETEIYAPSYKDGERVVLIRHPHGGIFEIPELTVNNKFGPAKKQLKDARDAVGISPRVAEQLSGADFDGDTVLVIPQKGGSQGVRVSKPLAGLKGFDPQTSYPGYPGMKKMTNTQTEMGRISNLITDMTIGGANTTEIAAAVRHSMVVIDAEKHGLNYKQSAIDNGIDRLRASYQPKGADGVGGAATIVSRAKKRVDVLDYKPRPAKDGGPIDKKTGELVFVPTGESYVKTRVDKKTGETHEETILRTKQSRAMVETKDAHTLVSGPSGTPIERIYADHANAMKGLANEARRTMVNTPDPKRDPSAARVYAPEVASLTAKLNIALKNAPAERQAMIVGNAIVQAKVDANPDMDRDDLKKVRSRALEEARLRTGASKQNIQVTPREWDAIQARAVSPHRLQEILRHTDLDLIKEMATPRATSGVSPAILARAKAMLGRDYTQAEVADALGISVTTLTRALD